MRIDQALDFIHACPPGKFESLSDLLSPGTGAGLFAETGSVSLRRRRMPMEGAMGHYRDVLVSSCPYGPAGQPARYPVTRRPAVCRPQRLHPGAPKLADQAVRQVFQQTATLWHQLCQHPTWAGLQLLAVDGVVWRARYPDNAGAFAKVENRPGETQYPQVRMLCQMELTSHLLTQTVMDSCAVNEMVLAEQLIEKHPIIA